MVMEWGGASKLSRQRSCACPSAVLDVGSWCNRSGRRWSLGLTHRNRADADGYYDDDEDGELEPLDYAAGKASTPRWRALWRRIVRGKRRIFHGAGGAAARVPYDPYTYAQNFEERGSTPWMEPENLSRSFSARFANPSGILRRFG